MPLAAGQTLSHYQVLGPLGAGGMGEVYRARDTRLEREVAIKVLPAGLADDPDRLRRFEREAKTLASLTHPNVAGIHGVDHDAGVYFLALELVPGEDLAAHLARGALPLDEALEVCRQIAEGLEAAHEAGIVHRDLKPANVRLTPEGTVKLLDFGLAKPTRGEGDGTGASSAQSDSFLMTEEGVVLGTPTYMSPEQARGKPVDRRTDLWALGCVLYECLTGERAFGGDTTPDVLAAIVGREPDWSRLPALPSRVDELLRRALVKDPRQRLRDAGEARVQLQLALEGLRSGAASAMPRPSGGGAGEAVAARSPGRSRAVLLVGALGLVAGAALGAFLRGPSVSDVPRAAAPRRLRVVVDELSSEPRRPDLSISPDGTAVAWTRIDGIHLRPLGDLAARTLTESSIAAGDWDDLPLALAWSPDSRQLAYATEGALWRIARDGGPPTLVARADDLPEAAQQLEWTEDGLLVYPEWRSRTLRGVPVLGGERVILLEADGEDTEHFDGACALPGGGLLVLRHRVAADDPDTLALLRDGELRDVLQLSGWDLGPPRFADGRIVLERKSEGAPSSLWSVPFDPDSGEVRGEPTLLLEGATTPSAARDGTLAYLLEEGRRLAEPVWVDLQGGIEPFGRRLEEDFLLVVSSHDGRQVFVSSPGSGGTVWAHDIERGVTTPVLKVDAGVGVVAGTLPDGRILGSDMRKQETFAYPLDGRSEPERITAGLLLTLAPDGRHALVLRGEPGAAQPLDILDLAGDGGPSAFRETSMSGAAPSISPDGRWALYASDKTGEEQIYLVRFPSGEREWPVSTDGARGAWFDAQGETIYLMRGGMPLGQPIEIWSVSFQAEPEVRLGAPGRLLALEDAGAMLTGFHQPSGRFLGFRRVDPASGRIVLERGW